MKRMKMKIKYIGLAVIGLIAPSILFAQETVATASEVAEPYIDSGNTAWMIMATALVMLMTIPGLALFYGGLVRQKNVLSILMQCFILTAVITLEWVFIGYSLSFSSSSGFLAPFIGGFDWAFLNGIGINDVSPYFISQETKRIPHLLFVLFQGMFAVITPALIIGAYAERIKFRGFLIFSVLWAILVYNPVAHWVWSADGWLLAMGALDFAGGTVVHINAGIAALVMTLMIGNRKNYNNHPTLPHNIPLVVVGTALLWFGWFGFNAGSGLAADGLAISAFLSTHVAAATAAFTWVMLDWVIYKKPTVIGVCTGAVAGLVAITPAAGFVGILGAVVIGMIVSLVCFLMVSVVKHKYGFDDTLDAFGVHGIGGIIGAVLTGLLATPAIQGSYSGLFYGNAEQLWIQVVATVVTMVFSGAMTFILFKIVDKIWGIRATHKEEIAGLDISQHHEMAYNETD